jgi:two-component system, sensor histidine kinase YesM
MSSRGWRMIELLADKVKTSFAHLSMQKKLVIVFLFLISLPITAVSYLSYQGYSTSIEENTTDYATEIAAKTMTKLDDYIRDLYNMSAMPLYNTDFLKDLASPESGLSKQNRMDLYIANLNKIKPDTVSVYVFDNYGRQFFNIKSNGIRNNMDEVLPVWRQIAREGNGKPMLVSTQEVSTGSATYYAFTVIRELKELTMLQPIGFIAFDTNISAIHRSIQNVDAVTKGKTLLVDEHNRVVFDSDISMITKDLTRDEVISKAVNDRGSFSITQEDTSYIVTYVKSQQTGWKMLVYIPVEEIVSQAASTRNFTFLTTIVIIGFALAASMAIAYALTRPLRKIKSLMQDVQFGRLDVSFNAKYNDEVGSLGRHFNLMVIRVQDLLEEVKETQARKKEAEINALQNQINPHFIYNTLETIRMTAEIKGDDEVADMTWTLGKLLRYGVTDGNEMVTVHDEMEHLRNYVALQNFRFSDRFVLLIDIPDTVLYYPCMKLLFQPIVENSINHAFKHREGTGTIRIHTEEDQSDIRFIIADDGVGMNDSALSRIAQRITGGNRKRESAGGLGLRNVNERIRLQYGDGYGLSVNRGVKGGTTITLKLPKPEVATHAQHHDRGR